LVSDAERETQIEGVIEQDAEKNIWTKRGGVAEGWRKLYSEELQS
jgi:hypothetical protein